VQQKDRDCEEKAPKTQTSQPTRNGGERGKKNRAGSFRGPSNPNLLPVGFWKGY